jgi:hypothetical protein
VYLVSLGDVGINVGVLDGLASELLAEKACVRNVALEEMEEENHRPKARHTHIVNLSSRPSKRGRA